MTERLFRFQASADYDSYTVHYTWHKKRRVIRELFRSALARCNASAPRVFDIGCGDGFDLFMLGTLPDAQKCSSFAGIDLNAEDIAYCRARAEHQADDRFSFAVRDVVAEPFSAGELGEIVLCSEVVEHIAEPEPFLAALAGAMPAQGMLILSTPNGSSWTGRVKRKLAADKREESAGVGHVSVLGRKVWRKICGQAGLSLLCERRGSTIYGSPRLDGNRLLAGMAIGCDAFLDLLGLNDTSWETLQLYVKTGT